MSWLLMIDLLGRARSLVRTSIANSLEICLREPVLTTTTTYRQTYTRITPVHPFTPFVIITSVMWSHQRFTYSLCSRERERVKSVTTNDRTGRRRSIPTHMCDYPPRRRRLRLTLLQSVHVSHALPTSPISKNSLLITDLCRKMALLAFRP